MKFSISPERLVPRGQDAGIDGVIRRAGGLGIKVLQSGRNTVIVDADDTQVNRLVQQSPGWLAEPVQTVEDEDPFEATLRFLRSKQR